jgi:hypothetical protein
MVHHLQNGRHPATHSMHYHCKIAGSSYCAAAARMAVVAWLRVLNTAADAMQVREMQKTVRDGRTGVESMTIQRGIGDRVSHFYALPCCIDALSFSLLLSSQRALCCSCGGRVRTATTQ